MDRIVLPPATNRKRALPQGELEAASTLKLGADQNTHTLSLSEARLVIHKVLENKRRGGNKYEEPEYVTCYLWLDIARGIPVAIATWWFCFMSALEQTAKRYWRERSMAN
jgi:hypothetical protein